MKLLIDDANVFVAFYSLLHDLKGKTVVPFATSGGSTIEKSCEDLKKTYPDLKWKQGKLLNSIDRAEIEAWAKE